MIEICDLCEAQKAKSRTAAPHEFLEFVSKQRHKEIRGGWDKDKYICNKCGATMKHVNDKGDFHPFWIVMENE